MTLYKCGVVVASWPGTTKVPDLTNAPNLTAATISWRDFWLRRPVYWMVPAPLGVANDALDRANFEHRAFDTTDGDGYGTERQGNLLVRRVAVIMNVPTTVVVLSDPSKRTHCIGDVHRENGMAIKIAALIIAASAAVWGSKNPALWGADIAGPGADVRGDQWKTRIHHAAAQAKHHSQSST